MHTKNLAQSEKKSLIFTPNRTKVMGILNVTPDSFSDGGNYVDTDVALQRARQMVAEGADILDIGGESTRPNAKPVSEDEELSRVIPVVAKIAAELDTIISVDTYKSEVARQALDVGAHVINDVWGGRMDEQILRIAAEYCAPIVLMHNLKRGQYVSLVEEILKDISKSVLAARQAGVAEHNIIVDPGVGFAKNSAQNLQVMQNIEQVVALGYPVLMGTSRKSFIGDILNLPVDERMEGTAATVAYGIIMGCKIVRVHDIKEMVRVSRMTDALLAGRA